MSTGPVVVGEGDREWECWPVAHARKGGNVHWKTLLSSDITESSAMTMGILKIPVSEALEEHSHSQPEMYLILAGEGVVTVSGDSRHVEAGNAIFIPGDALHSCRNTGDIELRFAYVFPTDSFAEIEYIFA